MVDAGVDDFQAALLPFVFYAPAKVLIGIAGLVCWVFCAVSGVLSCRNRSDPGVLLTMICCMPAALFIISKTVVPVFCSKQIAGFVPELALLAAAGFAYASDTCARLKMKVLHGMVIASFMLVLVINSYNFYVVYHVATKENWRDTARYVEKKLQPQDTIILLLNAQGPFQYYLSGPARIRAVKNIGELKALGRPAERCCLVYTNWEKKEFEAEINQYLHDNACSITRSAFNGTNVVFYRTADAL
jgi:hypothetical protein